MKMTPVISSNVQSVGYAPETKTLAVQFKSGGLYHHEDVSPEAHAAFMAAESKGKHYREHISKHQFKKVGASDR